MKRRCYNTHHDKYKYYGGRGIKVCREWKNSFETFYRDMGDPPTPQHSLDRINFNKNYSKNNCRWATRVEQMRNTRGNHNITMDGETLCISAWAERFGVTHGFLETRLKAGLSLRDAVTRPRQPGRQFQS
jgi:hypothetical protein